MGPVAARGSFRVVVNRLYYGKKEIATPHASHATHLIDADTIAEALQSIYRREFNTKAEIEPHLFRAFAEKVAEAVDEGYTANAAPSPDDAFRNALRHSADVFAAFKTHRTQSDMAAQLLDSNGNLKPFEQWKNDVQPIASHQCGAWLETEYNTAVLRARQAADWQQFEAEKDVLPNLKWLPSTSPNPGADHLPFWNTILPVEHPFWNQHRPGDRWNCKCELTSTDEPTTAVPKTPHPSGGAGGGSNPHRGLADNPGKTKSVFSQDHPYFPKNCNACPFYKPGFRAKLRALFYNQKKNCTGNCPYVNNAMAQARILDQYDPKIWKHSHSSKKTDGFVVTEKERIREAQASKNEKDKYKKEHNMCVVAADNGFRVEHLRGTNRPMGETYDTRLNEIPTDLKSTGSIGNIVKYIKKACNEQGAKAVLLELGVRTPEVYRKLGEAKRKYSIRIFFYFKEENIVREIP